MSRASATGKSENRRAWKRSGPSGALRFFVAALAFAVGANLLAPAALMAQTPQPPAPGDPPQVEVVATPVPVVRPTAVPSGDPLVRIVGVGETLASLAAQSGFSISDLAQRNWLTQANVLLAGQRVRLPARVSTRIRLHRVTPGETLTSLAAEYGVSPYLLRQTNNLTCVTCLVSNQLLRIPTPANQDAGNLPQPFDRVDVLPGQPQPGDVVVVRVAPNSPLDTVVGSFAGKTLRFVKKGTAWEALTGLSAIADIGVYPISVRAVAQSGAAAEVNGRIQVVPSGYGQENITIDYRLTPLLDPQINADERFQIDTLVSQFTPNQYYSGPFRLPVANKITSYFGARRTFNGGLLRTFHSGLDVSAPVGTPIHVGASGRVAAIQEFKVRGLVVIVDHGRGVFTLYCHLSKANVKAGQIVSAGEVIALSGNSGRSEGPHIHWELAVGGVTVDPLPYVTTPMP